MPLIAIRGIRPDLFFILIAFYSFFIYPNRTVHFAVFLGLIRELFSGTLLGFEVLAYGVSAFLLWFLVSKMERENFYNQGTLLFLYSFVNLLILSLLNISLQETSITFWEAVLKILGVSLYTILIAPFIFYFLKRFLKMSQRDLFGSTISRR